MYFIRKENMEITNKMTEKMLQTLMCPDDKNDFILSLNNQYLLKGSLSEKQLVILKSSYEKYIRTEQLIKSKYESDPNSTFYKSLLDQFQKRGSLSPKQIEAIQK